MLMLRTTVETYYFVQDQVDNAPTFKELMDIFPEFVGRNGLINRETGERTLRFCWCCDGGFDTRDFLLKQCFISKVFPIQ